MKIAVLTDPESAAGYRLGGLEVALAHDPAEAREVLARLVQTEDYALVIVNMTLLPDPYQAVKKELRNRDLPVFAGGPGAPSCGHGRGRRCRGVYAADDQRNHGVRD